MPLQAPEVRSRADQVYATLRRHIHDGLWKAEERVPSERALAEDLGVCRVTVARAVNRLAAEGFLHRRRGRGTFVATRASAAARPRTGDVALVVPFSHDPYISHLVKCAAETLSDAGYHLFFQDTHGDHGRELQQLQRLWPKVDGLLVYPTFPGMSRALYARILADGRPVVFMDHSCSGLDADWVASDNLQASFEAVRRLLDSGRRRIAHITTPEVFYPSILDRLMGFNRAMAEAGLPVSQEDIRIAWELPPGAPEPGSNGEGAANAALATEATAPYAWTVPGAPRLDVEPLLRSLLDRDGGVDAIFTHNDWTLLSCLHALSRMGVRVPEDVAVAGYADNDLVLANLPVPILAVIQPKDEIGRQGARLLIDRLRGDTSPPRRVSLPATVQEIGGTQPRGIGRV